jgi:single-strand DNA-binding protein
MNKIIVTGNAVKDIELKYSQSGTAIGNGKIAVRRNRKNQNGEYETDFFNFVCIGKGSEVMANYIKKGDKFGISGSLQTRIWEKDNGDKQYFTEILVEDFDLPSKSSNQSNSQPSDPFKGQQEISSNELPF